MPVNDVPGTFARTFTGFVGLDSLSDRVEASIDGVDVGSSGLFSLDHSPVATVDLFVKTPDLYINAGFEAVYQVRDAAGKGQVSTDGLLMMATFAMVASNETVELNCGTPDEHGIGSCRFTSAVMANVHALFSANDDVSVVITVSALGGSGAGGDVGSPTIALMLHRLPVHEPLDGAGVLVSLPQSPVFAGDTFTVTLVAHTGSYSMAGYGIELLFDENVLELDGQDGQYAYNTAVFSPPTVNAAQPGRFIVSAFTQEDTGVSGEAVYVVDVRFRVKSDAVAGDYDNVMSCVVDLINDGNNEYVSKVDSNGGDNYQTVHDYRDGHHTHASLQVQLLELIGILVYSTTSNELVNVASIGGAIVSAQIDVLAVFNKFDLDATHVEDAACSLASSVSASALHVSDDCRVQVDAGHEEGVALATIVVEYGSMVAYMPFRVWFPLTLTPVLSKTTLNAVSGTECPGSSGVAWGGMYQHATMVASATFGANGLTSIEHVDVTHITTVSLSTDGVVFVDGSDVGGLQAGVVDVSFHGISNQVQVTPTTVTVSNELVNAVELSVVVVNGAGIAGVPGEVSADQDESSAAFEARVTLRQILTAEGHTANVFVHVVYEDGTHQSLDRTDGVSVATTDHMPIAVTVVDDSQDGRNGWTLEVPVGAASNCGRLLQATWNMCGQNLTSGQALVNVAMPAPTHAVVTRSNAIISRNADPASASPINKPDNSRLSVVVHFEDATSKPFHLDSRTVYTIVVGSSMAYMDGRHVTAIEAAPWTGPIIVQVTFPGLYPDITAEVSLELVALARLDLSFVNYPSIGGSPAITMLSKIACTDVYQQGSTRLVASLTDGSTYTVTPSSAFTSSNVDAVTITSTSTLTGVNAGMSIIQGTFQGVSSNPQELFVSEEYVYVTSISLNDQLGSSSTLTGVADAATSYVTARVTFDDGTYFTNVVNENSLPSPAELGISFTSSRNAVVSIDANGQMTLHANHYRAVDITANLASQCRSDGSGVGGSGVSDSISVYANLQAPGDGQVDLGSTTGSPLSGTSVNGIVNVDVYVRSNASPLDAFQLSITFDYEALEALTGECSIGDDWGAQPGVLFSCTLNSPVDAVLLVGSTGSSSATGMVHVASFQLRAKAEGVHMLGGAITEVLAGSQVWQNTGLGPATAGVGVLVVPNGHKGASTAPIAITHGQTDIFRPPISLLKQDACSVLGDLTQDCEFKVSDVNLAHRIYAELESSSTMPVWQLQQMDPLYVPSQPCPHTLISLHYNPNRNVQGGQVGYTYP